MHRDKLPSVEATNSMDVILEYIINNWPDLALVIIVGITCIVISRRLTRWEDNHNRKHEELEKRTCGANCQSHESDINTLKQDLKEIKSDLVSIKSIMILKYKNTSEIFSMKKSPRQLNENGERLFSDIKGNEFLTQNKEFLFCKIEEQRPKTALDVEIAANLACSSNIDNDIFNGMKDFVYNSPSYTVKDKDGNEREYDISLSDICFVLSIPLRDMYLNEHQEIK